MSAKKARTGSDDPFFTVLVVDRDPGTLQACEGFLRARGNFVFSAESAEAAIVTTRKFSPDLILIGSEQLGRSARSLASRLLELQPSAAIILLVEKPTAREAVQAIKMGVVDILRRPLDLQDLKEAIEFHKTFFK